jgi:hypothetical protein
MDKNMGNSNDVYNLAFDSVMFIIGEFATTVDFDQVAGTSYIARSVMHS